MIKIFYYIFILSYGVIIYAQSPSGTTLVSASPEDICRALVSSAKNKNYEGIRRLTAGEKPRATSGYTKYSTMDEKYFSHFQSLRCGDSFVDGNRAMVQSHTAQDKRLLPFVKVGNNWKFDAQSYRVSYDSWDQKTKTR